jgi:hypothetical protein
MTKKFPSQIKYERENPTITFRMKIHEKEKIQGMARRSGKSISKLVRMALLGLENDYSIACQKSFDEGKEKGIEEGREKGYKEGRQKGTNEWAIWCLCSKCKNRMYIQPNSYLHKEVIKVTEGYLEHAQCPEEA